MADLRPEHEREFDRISAEEEKLLRQRLTPTHELFSLEDVAEATGMPLEEVKAHLSRLRAERAFRARPERRIPWLAIAGVIAIVTGGTISWIRTRPESVAYPPAYAGPGGIAVPRVSRPLPNLRQLPTTVLQTPPHLPPPGFRISMVGKQSEVQGDGWVHEATRMVYEVERDQIATSLEALVRQVAVEDAKYREVVGPVRDSFGNPVHPSPGLVHYAFDSWASVETGWLTSPVTSESRHEFKEVATRVLSEIKTSQDKALQTSGVNVSEGIVSPPPGFRVTYAGRRLDEQSGPRWAFDKLNPKVVVERLRLSIENAILRDKDVPAGPWRGEDQKTAKMPVPRSARVEVDGPQGIFRFDVSPRLSASARAAKLRNCLAPAADQILKENAKVLTKPTDGRP